MLNAYVSSQYDGVFGALNDCIHYFVDESGLFASKAELLQNVELLDQIHLANQLEYAIAEYYEYQLINAIQDNDPDDDTQGFDENTKMSNELIHRLLNAINKLRADDTCDFADVMSKYYD